MKTVIDYLKEHGKYEHDTEGCAFELILKENQILLNYKDGWAVIKTDIEGYEIENVITEILENHNIDIRFCEECGKPFDKGYIAGDGDWYCCEDCFVDAMNNNCGTGKWRPTNNEGQYGGFYEVLEEDGWIDTGIYYTEWN